LLNGDAVSRDVDAREQSECAGCSHRAVTEIKMQIKIRTCAQ
jgi:hypothetical protein